MISTTVVVGQFKSQKSTICYCRLLKKRNFNQTIIPIGFSYFVFPHSSSSLTHVKFDFFFNHFLESTQHCQSLKNHDQFSFFNGFDPPESKCVALLQQGYGFQFYSFFLNHRFTDGEEVNQSGIYFEFRHIA